MTLSESLRDDGGVTFRRRGDEIICGEGSDRLASVAADRITLDERRLEVRVGRGYEVIVDAGTGSRLAIIRRRAHGPIAVDAGRNRYRITRQGLRFWSRLVTHGVAGATVMRALRVGPFVRLVTTEDSDGFPAHDLALVGLAVVHTWFGLGDEATRAEGGVDLDEPRADTPVPAPASE